MSSSLGSDPIDIDVVAIVCGAGTDVVPAATSLRARVRPLDGAGAPATSSACDGDDRLAMSCPHAARRFRVAHLFNLSGPSKFKS